MSLKQKDHLMTHDRRPGDFVDALGKGLVVYYAFPLLAGLMGALGMIVGLILAIPCYLIFWISPEEFLAKHTGIFIVFWGIGIAIVTKGLLFPNTKVTVTPETKRVVGEASLILLGAFFSMVLVIGVIILKASMKVE